MRLVTKVEAAIILGISIELLDYFTKYCPKSKENRKLKKIKTDIGDMFDEKDVLDYKNYLNEPWPKTTTEQRPDIPKPIMDDIKAESHFACAICGFMDNGEVAHIEPVAETMNNSPDNLIFLCPNHHTKYDYGYKPSSNVTPDAIKAAKIVKRDSRRRMLRCEENVMKLFVGCVKTIKLLEEKIEQESNKNLSEVYLTEAINIIQDMPKLLDYSKGKAKEDNTTDDFERLIAERAPNIAKIAIGIQTKSKETDVRSVITSVVNKTREILIDIDEVECPRCGGSGTTGLVGDLCAYCHGSCFISNKKAEAYDEEEIDEVECPHCKGRGTTGLVGDLCAYCHGSCFISNKKAEAYDEEEIDEVECPHCKGRGTTGLVGDLCAYCHGSCFISNEKAEAYDEEEIDGVECPRCGGSGTTGLVGDLCALCKGSCFVSKDINTAYKKKYGCKW